MSAATTTLHSLRVVDTMPSADPPASAVAGPRKVVDALGGWAPTLAIATALLVWTPVGTAIGHQPLIGLVLGFAVATPLERRWKRHDHPILRQGLRTDVLHFMFTHPLRIASTALAAGICYVVLSPLTIAPTREWVAGLNTWQTAVAAYLGVAVAYYFEHRAAHSWGWLWRFHAVHHSSERLDWLAATRLHPFEGFLGGFIIAPPLILFGFEASDFAIGGAVFGILDVMVHANVNWRMRWLDGIVATPEYHHWHHVSAPVRDVNFSLPIVDMLFGTYHMPDDGSRPEIYGIDDDLPDSYLGQLAWSFRRDRPVS